MPQVDEGLIHAWLDGQLPPAEAARVEQLVATDVAARGIDINGMARVDVLRRPRVHGKRELSVTRLEERPLQIVTRGHRQLPSKCGTCFSMIAL